MELDDAIVEFGFDCKVRKLSEKTVSSYQKQSLPSVGINSLLHREKSAYRAVKKVLTARWQIHLTAHNRFMNALEQAGRYACIVLMWLPLLVWRFGFTGTAGMTVYLAGNAALLAAYWAVSACYYKKKTRKRALALAVLPTCIFLLSGLTLRHRLLVFVAVLFGIGHIFVTLKNAE